MSTPVCRSCGRNYWRYSNMFWPRGYCSVPCWEARKKKEPERETAWDAVEAMRLHRWQVHGSKDLTAWYDCTTCEMLEGQYARAQNE